MSAARVESLVTSCFPKRVESLASALALGALAAVGSGCNNAGEGALSGAALGAGGGAIIGSLFGGVGTGAAIGAVGGALGGALVGDQNERNRQNANRRDW